jgi:hypothetical protein
VYVLVGEYCVAVIAVPGITGREFVIIFLVIQVFMWWSKAFLLAQSGSKNSIQIRHWNLTMTRGGCLLGWIV